VIVLGYKSGMKARKKQKRWAKEVVAKATITL